MNVRRMSIEQLNNYVGRLSTPSKMPGWSYGLPAEDCHVGTRLRSVSGSTCHSCYAFERGAYAWKGTKRAYRRRARAIGRKYWVPAMIELLNRKRAGARSTAPVMRWHDSGDLQSVRHFADICQVAAGTPAIPHWLPTREYRIVSEYVAAGGVIPENLNVRLSAHMIGGAVPTFPRLRGLVTVSTVSAAAAPAGAHVCPAPTQGNECGSCRACWSRNVPVVDYHLH